jgi:glyoxylase-like metal-dependent hydrolase (beta-lactamase superfamily II)
MTNFTAGVEMVEVADGVFARLHEGLTNAGIILGDEGVLVIDSLRVPSFARDLIADVRRLTDRPVRYVIDTHSHWDHAWGNEEFPHSVIVGHANCRAEMRDLELTRAWRERVRDRRDPWSEEAQTVTITPPALTFEDTMQIWFGGRRIDLRYLGRAHTSGDIFIHLPEQRLVFTGDVAQDRGVPYVLDGYMRDWVETDTRLLGLEADRFVSGHGPVGEASRLVEARDFVAALVTSVERSIADGRDEAGTKASAVAEMRERFGGWRGFERVEESAGYTYRQLRAG